MAGGTATDAKRVFEALAAHLAGKRMELSVAIEQERGIEGWLQHEAVVALDNAYRGDLAGRLYTVRREGLRHKDASTYDPQSRRRPFDLVFDAPDMAASLKLYMPWQSINEATKDMIGDVVPAEITVFEDRSFEFKLKTPPVAALLKKYAGIEKGSAEGAKKVVGKVTRAHVNAIAERKLPDLNVYDIPAAGRMIEGTAKNMGIKIEG